MLNVVVLSVVAPRKNRPSLFFRGMRDGEKKAFLISLTPVHFSRHHERRAAAVRMAADGFPLQRADGRRAGRRRADFYDRPGIDSLSVSGVDRRGGDEPVSGEVDRPLGPVSKNFFSP